MKTETPLLKLKPQSLATQMQSGQQLPYKAQPNICDGICRPKPSPRLLLTKKVHRLVRMADGSLQCMCCGRKTPLMPGGGLDLVKLRHEIALRLW